MLFCTAYTGHFQVRLLHDKTRPCTETLESCSSLSDSDEVDGKMTDSKLLGTFWGDQKSYLQCNRHSGPGLTFDLLPTERFEHGQVLVVMTNANGLDPDVEIFGEEDPGEFTCYVNQTKYQTSTKLFP